MFLCASLTSTVPSINSPGERNTRVEMASYLTLQPLWSRPCMNLYLPFKSYLTYHLPGEHEILADMPSHLALLEGPASAYLAVAGMAKTMQRKRMEEH